MASDTTSKQIARHLSGVSSCRVGKILFGQALAAGTAASFFKLIEQFRTQDEPAYCGLATLAMVLNSLSIGVRPSRDAAKAYKTFCLHARAVCIRTIDVQRWQHDMTAL